VVFVVYPEVSVDPERMETRMKHTLGTAAKAVGKSKSTISKAIKKGRITAHKLPNRSYEIEPVELHRVYPPTPSQPVAGERLDTPNATWGNSSEIRLLQARLEMAQERIADLEGDRDQWRQTANRLLERAEPTKGFLAHLLGR